jgi:hypothetical protein
MMEMTGAIVLVVTWSPAMIAASSASVGDGR